MDAFDWTNLQFVVSASSASSTLEFDFNDIPGAFGLDDVTVSAVSAAPALLSVATTGGNITLSWNSVSNHSYQVQSSATLGHPGWTNLGNPILATGDVASASEPMTPGSQQFYRVMLLPSH